MNYYIQIDRRAIPVSEEIYKAYCKGIRKERYFAESDIHNHTFSYDSLDCEDGNGCELFKDTARPSPEEQMLQKDETDQLYQALKQLSEEEQRIILRLYYYNDTYRNLAASCGIPVSTLHRRHGKILEKLRKLMS